jgi:hypothetical protein
MRRLAAVALLMVGMTIPLCAQRGGSHGGGGFHGGGFSGHSASSFHSGGFGGSAPSRGFAPSRTSMAPRSGGGGYRGVSPGYRMRSGGGYGTGYGRTNSANRGRGGNGSRRPPYRPVYRSRVGYGILPWTGWVGAGYPWYPDGSGYDDSAGNYDSGANYPEDGYDAQPTDQYPPPPEAPAQSNVDSARPSQALAKADAVTLVFKDGRPPEQIHNYILSGTTLSVWDEHHRDIPVEELDLAATEKVNRDAGVTFHLPDAGK